MAGVDFAEALPEPVQQGFGAGAARHGEHAGGFADHEDVGVFVEDAGFAVGGEFAVEGVGFDVQAFQHEAQQGAAFAGAGGVEAALLADFRAGGGAVPEFAHGEGRKMMAVSVLQELRGGAVARAAGRDKAATGEDFADGEGFAAGVADAVLVEDPGLQLRRRRCALRSGRHGGNFRLALPEIALRRRQIVDWRHEPRERRPPPDRPAERIQVILPSLLILYFKYP